MLPHAAAVGALLATSALLTSPVSSQAASALPARAALPYSHLPAVLSGLVQLRATSASELINIDFALKPRNAERIPALLAKISDPASPAYGRYLSQADYRNQFGPTQAQVNKVIAFAKAQGFIVTHVSASGLIVRAAGTASQLESAFGVKLRDYVSPDPRDGARVFHAPDREPTVAAAVAPLLTGIVGLSNAGVPHSFAHPAPMPFSSAGPTGPAGTGHGGAISPYDVANIYSLNTSLKSYSGKNQVLGLLEINGYQPSDITTWESYYPLTATFPTLVPISVDNASTSVNEDTQLEVELDIDMLLSLAYNASQIRVYEEGEEDNLSDVFDAMANDSTMPTMISVSYGYYEDELDQSYAQSEAQSLQQLALQGQTVCVASGDAGAYTDQNDNSPNVSDPASQPTVVSVGGTNLYDSVSSGGVATFYGESSWYDASDGSYGDKGTGGGGGVSAFWSIPSWQVGAFSASANPQGSAAMRNLPDVSLFGDFDTGGYDVYIGGWGAANGTSASAPLWAAILADVNQERLAAGKPILGLAAPEIYSLAKSSAYGTDFYDIADNSTNGYYNAVKGFDNSTGWGSPLNGSQMIGDLAAQSAVADFTLSVSATSVGAGGTITGTVKIAQPAKKAETFTLTSSNTNALSVPASVTIAAGATSAAFSAKAGTVSSNTSVSITAALNAFTASQSVTVTGSGPSLSSVTVASSSVAGGVQLAGNRVALTGSATASTIVKLSSSNTAVATVPSSETIQAGSASHSFTITTSTVTSPTTVTITATLNGVSKTAQLTVLPSLSSVKLAASSAVGGTSLTGNRVYFTGNVNTNTSVSLASSNTSVATVPSTETILSGSSSHSFTITTKPVAANTTVTITATSGGVTKTATLTVTP